MKPQLVAKRGGRVAPATFELPVVRVSKTRDDLAGLVTEWGKALEEVATVDGPMPYRDWLRYEAWLRKCRTGVCLTMVVDRVGNVALAEV